jgi:hypothetical protein
VEPKPPREMDEEWPVALVLPIERVPEPPLKKWPPPM